MCERIELHAGVREISRHFGRLQISARDLPDDDELAPGEPLLIISSGGDGARASNARWGLVGHFLDQSPRSPLLHLRGETLAATPFYNRLLRRKRCLIPATAFMSWQSDGEGQRRKLRIAERDGELLLLAAIFDHHPHAGSTCAVLTAPAIGLAHGLQPRLPLLLQGEAAAFWLAEHAEFPEDEFATLLQPTEWPSLLGEYLPEPEPSPQLCFDFALTRSSAPAQRWQPGQ
ncbi:SOS response-associated peptidase family protein [Dechloromonas sp. ZY10]|uniref:SOS response-associated peptidase family protein n=1 Tax=Dechloromonas aquae TaxID=2664436 RepID=UPI00352722FD